MKILPDSYALIEFYKGSKEGEKVKKHLRKGNVIISSICTYEVLFNLGRYYSKKAAEGTIRALYGTDNQMNAAHGSDSEESFKREYAIFF